MMMTMHTHLSPLVALIVGILILIFPRFLNYFIAIYGRSLQLGEGGIAADIRYAFGTPMSCSKRSPMPDAMPQRQHTS